jgi:hypothetical protein
LLIRPLSCKKYKFVRLVQICQKQITKQYFVGRTGLEPVTPCVSCKCATRLRQRPAVTTYHYGRPKNSVRFFPTHKASGNADLVIDALLMNFQRRQPDEKLIHHSDRGKVYTSPAFGNRAAELGVTRSFGSTGNCYNNAAVEALWEMLRRELNWISGKQP